MKKRILSMLLAIAMVCSLLPTVAFAAETTYNLWVGGVQVTSANMDDITTAIGNAASGTATYDPDTKTLTLNNFSYTGEGYVYDSSWCAAIFSKNDLTVKVMGSNTVTASVTGSYTAEALNVWGALTITGDSGSSLTLTGAGREDVGCGGNLRIENVTVTAAGGEGISSDEGITIDNAIVTAVGNGDNAIYSTEAVSITNSSVTATAPSGDGIFIYNSYQNLTINNSMLTASVKSNGINVSMGSVHVTNSFIDITTTDGFAIESRSGGGQNAISPSFTDGSDNYVVYAGDDAASATEADASDAATYANKYVRIEPLHKHCVCGGSIDVGGHTHDATNPTWTAWDGTDAIAYTDGVAYVYLSADAKRSGTLEIPTGNTLYLCLNGNTLDGGSGNAIEIGQNGTVIVCDCSGGNGSITATGEFGRGIYSTDASAKTTLYGVTISGCSYAGIECRSGEVNLYDSKITNCTGSRGGIEMQYSTGIVRLFNSDITNCSSSASGSASAAYVSENATLELHGDCDISECPDRAIYLNGTLKLVGDYTKMTLPAIEIGSSGTIDVTALDNLTSVEVNPSQISAGTGIVLARGTADPSRFTFTDPYNIYTYGKENQVFMVKPWPLAWSNVSTVLATYPTAGAWYKGGANITVTPKDGFTLYETLGGEAWGGSFNVGNTTQKTDVEKIIFAYDSASTKYYKLTLTYKVDAGAPTIVVGNLPDEGEYCSTRNVYLTINDDVNYSSDLAITVTCNGRNYELSGSPRYFKADQNGIYVITATDKVGNVTTVHQEINFIDDADPEIISITVPDPDGENDWYITQPTVTVSAEDSQSGVKEYSFDGGSTWQASASKTFSDGTHTVTIQVKDNANKVAEYGTPYTLHVDTVKPVVNTSVSATNWTNGAVVVTATVNDSISGVEKVEYSLDSGNTWNVLEKTGDSYTYSMTENGTICFRATDVAGNVSETESVTVGNIDKVSPAAAFGTVPTANEYGWYTSDVVIPVVVSDDNLKEWKYQLNDGSWTKGTGNSFTISVDDTYSVKIKAIDDAGNETEVTPITIKLDKTAPVIGEVTGNPTAWTKHDVTLTVTASDDTSGVAAYSFDGGSTWQALNTNTFTENTANIVIQVRDNAGNVTTYETDDITKIDKNAPEAAFGELPTVTGENGWYTENVDIPVTVSDMEELSKWYYSLDNGTTWTKGTGSSFTISENDDYTDKVKIKAVDAAGKETVAGPITVKLDKATPDAPTVTAQVDGVNHASDTWTAGDVMFTPSGGITTSGVAKYQYSTDGGNNWTDMADNTVTHSSNTAASGVTYIFRAVNNAGAAGTPAAPYIVKRSKLTAEELAATQYGAANLTIDSSPISEAWYATLPTITIEKETSVGEGGLAATTYYKLYESDVTAPAVGTELTGNTIAIPSDGVWTLMLWTEDVAGNQTAVYTDTVKADSVTPVIGEVTDNPGSWVADQAVIRFTASDVTSGIASITVTRNDVDYPVNANSFTADQNGNYIIKVIDNAGHETTKTVEVTKIDVTAPTAAFDDFDDPDSTGWYKDDVTIPVTVSDVEELSKWYYSLNNGVTWEEETGNSFTISDNGDYVDKVKIKAVDAVDKETVAGPITVKLDKATPEAPTVIAEVDNTVYTSGTWTTGNVVFTLSGGITTSGLDTYQYSTDGGVAWNNIDDTTFAHTASTDDSGVTYIFRAVNNAGKAGTASGSTKVLKRQPYTIQFSANAEDATGTMGDLTAYLDTNIQLTANAFEREGYSFMGWATTEEGPVVYTDKQNVPEALTDQMNAEVVLYAVWSENPVISGTITGTGDTDVTVKLRDLDGNEYPAVVTPSGDDFIYTVTVPVGSYQLIVGATVTDDSVTLTYAEDMSASKTHDIAIPTSNKNSSVVEIVDGAPEAIVDGLDAIASADPGSGVEIKLTVTAEEHNSSDAEQTAIRTEARGKTLEFVDLTLTKNGSDIGDTNTQLLTIVVPFEKGNKLDITVYRYHDDKAEELDENPANGSEGFVVGTDSITIYAMKFSAYAIGYTVPYYPTTYSVVVENAVNGTVKANPSYATSGSTVTVAVTPDKGYVLDKLTVTDIFGREVDVAVKDGKYTFKMPAAKVTVKATFKEEVAFQNPFEDVFTTDYYYDAVLWAVKEGITNGTSATTFSPNAPCTRAQMVTFLWRAAGSPEPTTNTCPFTDVDMDSYYGKAVLWAVENGITNGTSGTTFSPDMECSRAQMATFLCRMAGGKAESDTIAFTDVKSDAYYAESVQWAVENGITNGTGDNKFSPDATCTRGQMVTFLYRYYVK